MAALVNIYPVSSIGRSLKLGRFLFHHYVYGLIVLLIAILGVIVITPISFLSLFIIETSDIAINTARFFILGGLALLLDDLPDSSKWVEYKLNWLKAKVYELRKFIHYLQLFLSAVLIYLFSAIYFWVIHNPQWLNVGNIILIGTISITTITTIALAKRKFWLRITIKEQ